MSETGYFIENFTVLQVITDPEVYAKRKIKKQQAKKVAKTKKVNSIKGRVRKNHRVDRNVDTDF